MSFKDLSAFRAAPSTDKPEYKIKTASVVDQPAAQPGEKPAGVAPAQKS